MKKIGQVTLLKNNYVEDDEMAEFLERTKETREKYPNLIADKDKKSGKYFYKYCPSDVEALITDLKSLKLTKEMALININKYGYSLQQDYILESLGFKVDSNYKLKVNKAILKQADLFRVLYSIDKECFIRLRNKSTEEYRAYPVNILQDPYRLQAILKSNYFSNNDDMMYSLNCFNNMYKADEQSLFSLQNIAIDCDFDTDIYTVLEALELIKKKINIDIPSPTIVEYGHRIRLLFSISDVAATKKSIRLYNKIAKELARRLTEVNAKAQPPTTFARMEGSTNTKTGVKVETLIVNPVIYKMSDLSKALLPEYKSIKQEVNRAIKKGTSVVKMPNAYGLNLARLRDFERIQRLRTVDKCDSLKEYKYYRALLCYLYRNYCRLCNMTSEEALEATIMFNNLFEIPMKVSKLITNTNNVDKKRYLYKTETIIELFGITPAEEREAEFEKIVSESERLKRYSDKYKEKLNSEGKMTKKEQLEQLRAKIKSLRLEGFKNKDIAQELGIPIKTLERHITIMRKNGLL